MSERRLVAPRFVTPASSRRDFLRSLVGTLAISVAAPACRGGARQLEPGPDTQADDVLAGDALAQAARIRSGAVTPSELVEAVLRRIDALDGRTHSVVTRLDERALREASAPLPDGPFRGVPLLLKDLNDLEGTRKTMGSRLFADYVSTASSPHTKALLEAGFVVVGKSNTPEFGLVPTTESALLGDCHNPWNPDYSTGGSSGGAAAAVAVGILPLAQASDGGGSIRVPASCCGIFGLKSSRGRNRAAPPTRRVDISIKGAVSRSVRDSAAYLSVTERKDPGAPFAPVGYVAGPDPRRLRIGFHTLNIYGQQADPEVRAAIEASAALCASLGHEVAPASPSYEGEAFAEAFLDLWTSIPAGVLASVEARGIDPETVLEPVTIGMAERFRGRPAGALDRAVDFMAGYTGRIDGFFGDRDVLLTPVLRTPPPRLGVYAGTLPFERVFEPMIEYVSYTPVWNATGHPAMSVPLGLSRAGLPIGSHFVAPRGAEATLLSLAYELEAAQPWANRLPIPSAS